MNDGYRLALVRWTYHGQRLLIIRVIHEASGRIVVESGPMREDALEAELVGGAS